MDPGARRRADRAWRASAVGALMGRRRLHPGVVADDEVERLAPSSTRSPVVAAATAVGLVASLSLAVALGIRVTGWAWGLVIVPLVSLIYLFVPGRVARVLRPFPVTPSAVIARAWLVERRQLAELAAQFCSYLGRCGVDGARMPTASLPILPPPDVDVLLVDTLVGIARQAIGSASSPQSPGPPSPDGRAHLSLLAAGEFLAARASRRGGAIREAAHRGWGQGELFGQLVLAHREIAGAATSMPRKQALGVLGSTGRTEPLTPHSRELGTVMNALRDGAWPPTYVDIVEESIDQSASEHPELVTVSNNPVVDRRLGRLLGLVSFHTFQRFLETRHLVGYLLTFHSRTGSLATVLDGMPDARDRHGRLRFEEEGQPRYSLVPYHPHSRIGVVPRNMTFDEFSERFASDFATVYARAERAGERFTGADVTLQRLRFGQQFRVVEGGGAVERLREATARAFTPKERAALLGYEPDPTFDVLDLVLELSLVEAAEGIALTGHRATVESVDEKVRDELLAASGFATRGELAVACAVDAVPARTLLSALLAGRCPTVPAPISAAIATAYVDAFATVGAVRPALTAVRAGAPAPVAPSTSAPAGRVAVR